MLNHIKNEKIARCGLGGANKFQVLWILFALLRASLAYTAQQNPPADSSNALTMSLDVSNANITDVLRMVSRDYNLNLVIDKNVKGTVTLHLSSVPLQEGIAAIAQSLELVVVKEGEIYYLRQKQPDHISLITVLANNKLKVEAHDADVRAFLEELSKKSGASIVFDEAVQGQITGKLINVPFEDGLKAILEGNGYKVVNEKGIYRVTSDFSTSGQPVVRHAVTGAAYPFYVNYANKLVSLDARNVELSDVMRALAKEAGVQVVTYGEITGKVDAQIDSVSFDEAIDVLLAGTNYTYIWHGKMILLGNRNATLPSGQALTTSEMVPLNHLKAEDVPSVIPANIPATNIKVIKEQNALLITGTSIDILRVKDFVKTIDIPTPQVIIDVIVVEYSMDNDFDFSFGFGLDATVPNNNTFPNIQISRQGAEARNLLSKIFGQSVMKSLGYLGDDFFIRLQMAAQQNKAKVLAQPSITVLNGHKASINVGQTQYFKIIIPATSTETALYRFQPISFGINVSITPWIAPSGQITADISPEISNAMGINADGYPNVFTRSVGTTVRLKNNETIVLGGLIRREENLSNDKVPLLGDIPILGNLFKTTKKTEVATNLAIYMTPHIIDRDIAIDMDSKIKSLGFKDIDRQDATNFKAFKSSDLNVNGEHQQAPKHRKRAVIAADNIQKQTARDAKAADTVARQPKAAPKADAHEDMIIDIPQKGKPNSGKDSVAANARRHDRFDTKDPAGLPPPDDDDFYIPPPRTDN